MGATDAITEEERMPPTRLTPALIRRIRGADTQSEFAHAVGVSANSQVSLWERGHRHPSRIVTRAICRLAQARGVDLQEAPGA